MIAEKLHSFIHVFTRLGLTRLTWVNKAIPKYPVKIITKKASKSILKYWGKVHQSRK